MVLVGDQRAGHDGDHIQGTGGSPKVRDGGDLGPERKTAAVGQGMCFFCT